MERKLQLSDSLRSKLRAIINKHPYNEWEAENTDGNYFRLQVWRDGDLDEIENIYTPSRRFDALRKRCNELVKDSSVTMLELQYGNLFDERIDWIKIFETQFTK